MQKSLTLLKNLQEIKCNPKQLCKYINELTPKSRKPVTSPKTVGSKIFNSSFPSIPHKISSENHFHLPYNSINLDNYVKTKMPLEKSFNLPPVSYHFVHEFLSSLDINKVCGLHEVSPKYLEMCANVVSPLITSILIKVSWMAFSCHNGKHLC